MTWLTALAGAAAVGSAAVGGLYAVFSARIMPRLRDLPDAAGIARMQALNRGVEQIPFLAAFFGTALMSTALIVHAGIRPARDAADVLAASGGVLHLAGFVITLVCNVPRNRALASVVPSAVGAAAMWRSYRLEWAAANTVRACLSLVGAGLLLAAAVLGARR